MKLCLRSGNGVKFAQNDALDMEVSGRRWHQRHAYFSAYERENSMYLAYVLNEAWGHLTARNKLDMRS